MIEDVLTVVFANQWLVIGFASVLLLASAELGYRVGIRVDGAKDQARSGQIYTIQGAILGLLALLLGFTFAMAVSRYDRSRDLVLQEANAIGTTYLRASLLPEAHREAVEEILRRYVGVRLDFYGAGYDEEKLARAEESAAAAQRELWSHAAAAAKEAPTPVVATFVQTLNDTIDLDATRLHAMRTRVPRAVWLLVLIVAAAGCWASGYGAGTSGARSGIADVALPLLVAVVITLISDLDRPRVGMIRISQQPLIDLQASIMLRPAK